MQEVDNRKIADSFAEFITPIPLREFLKKEVGDCKEKTIFDCAVGSGQLLYNIDAKKKIGCDIQDRKEVNNKNGIIFTQCDYITYDDNNLQYDYVISNYPFSLRATEQQEQYLKDFWQVKKINRILDEHFILKSFRKAEKGFYLCFTGISYRQQEREFRKYLIDNNYVEKIYTLKNCGFEATSINILYLQLNKKKINDCIEICEYDFKQESNETKTITNQVIIDDNYNWNIYKFFLKEQDNNIYIEDFENAVLDYYLYENNISLKDISKNDLLKELLKERPINKKEQKAVDIKELNFSILKDIIKTFETDILKQYEYSKVFEKDFIKIKEYVKKELKDFLFLLEFK